MVEKSFTALRALAVFTVLTGVIYPMAVTLCGTIFFPAKVKGSLVYRDGKVIGSHLLAQKFEDSKYFYPRPSSSDYSSLPSGASNLSPSSGTLIDLYHARLKTHGKGAPPELLFASGSGLDPDLSTEAALFQVPRVAQARGLSESDVTQLVHAQSDGNLLNVLDLNLALEEISPLR